MNINNILTENDFKDLDVDSQLEHQFQIQETKESGWIFDKNNSMNIRFCKTGELSGSSCMKIPLGSKALISFKNNDKICFIRSILSSLYPCSNDHPNRVPNFFNNISMN